MTLAVGVFDLFTYGIPGALHLSLIIYVLAHWNMVDLGALTTAPSALQVIAGVVASYLLGHLAHPCCWPQWSSTTGKRRARSLGCEASR